MLARKVNIFLFTRRFNIEWQGHPLWVSGLLPSVFTPFLANSSSFGSQLLLETFPDPPKSGAPCWGLPLRVLEAYSLG